MQGHHLKYLFLAFSLGIALTIGWYLQRPVALEARDGLEIQAKLGIDGPQVTDIRLVQYDEEQRTKWTLTAPSAVEEPGNRIVVQDPRLSIFRKQGSEIRVSAHQGIVDKATREMTFSQEVLVEDGDTGRLSTEQLRFDPAQRMLYTDHKFRFKGHGMHLAGEGLTLLQDERLLKVKQRVKMVIPNGLGGAV
ncbi:MAG: LPS export ABC transporter periplasmic protein LptC [Magnetococcales bacterium]|nr:LPS export ABC transporter periplasmic protein LptC [Magnetococcales bacterium]